MCRIVLGLSLLLLVNGAPNPAKLDAKIQEYENINNGLGSYSFRFVTSDGTARQETGHLVNVGQPNQHMVVEGFYSYTDSDGNFQLINYTADDKGYVVQPPLPLDKTGPGLIVASLLGK